MKPLAPLRVFSGRASRIPPITTMYSTAVMAPERSTPIGTSRCGSTISSLAPDSSSKPTSKKTMLPITARKPLTLGLRVESGACPAGSPFLTR